MVAEAKETAAPKTTAGATRGIESMEANRAASTESTVGNPLNWPGQALGETGRFFENLFSRDFPAVDIVNREQDVLVRVELMGAKKEDLQVIAGETSVTVRGALGLERSEDEGEYIRREIKQRQSFSRTMGLPVEVEATKGKARYRDNILEVTLPKSEKLHTIKVE